MHTSSINLNTANRRSNVIDPGRVVLRPGDWLLAAAFALPAVVATPRFRRILLAIALLEIPFRYGINLGWREEDALLGALGGLEISLTTIAILGLYLSLMLQHLLARR